MTTPLSPDTQALLDQARRTRASWPKPTTEHPSMDQLEDWVYDSVCESTDGCEVEPDGTCPHGHPSWLLRLGLI